MAKLTYLQLVNRVLKRVTQPEISTVSGITGTTKIIGELINEAQTELWTETTNWYTLFTSRTVATVAGTSTYAVASDWGRTHLLKDTTNNRVLIEDVTRAFEEDDPDADQQGTPTHFSVQGGNYRIFPTPDGIYSLTDQYWKVPTALSGDSDTYDLPLFCENFLIHWAWLGILEYMNKFELADRIRIKIHGNPSQRYEKGMLERIKIANSKILDKMLKFSGASLSAGIMPPKFPASYGARYY